jgi:hypothetical protein
MLTFIVRSSVPNNGIRRIHLSRNVGAQPEEIYINALPETLPETFEEGDEWSVEFTLIRRAGSNGANRA